MAAPKRATHVINHKNLYLRVDGAMQKVPIGTGVVMTEKQAEKLGNKVVSIKEAKTLDLTILGDGKSEADADAEKKGDK